MQNRQPFFFCNWHEDEAFHIEDVETNIIMSISILQLRWFIEMVKESNKNFEDYFYKKEKVERCNSKLELGPFFYSRILIYHSQ